jgi:hypothetical protein
MVTGAAVGFFFHFRLTEKASEAYEKDHNLDNYIKSGIQGPLMVLADALIGAVMGFLNSAKRDPKLTYPDTVNNALAYLSLGLMAINYFELFTDNQSSAPSTELYSPKMDL